MSKYYTLNTKVSLRKGGRTIKKMSELEFASKAKQFILDTCKEDSWVIDKISNTDNVKKIISYLPSAIREVYWDDKKGKTTIKKDFKGITPDWENYDMVGGLRTVKGTPYIIMSVGGDWECPICIMVYHDGKQFRCYIPEKGNAYRKDTKTLFGNYDDSYNSETGEYEDEIKSKKLKKTIPSDDKYAFDQLVKDGILDKEKDIDKKKGLGSSIEYNTDMCIEDFSSRVEVKENMSINYNALINDIAKIVKKSINEYYQGDVVNVKKNFRLNISNFAYRNIQNVSKDINNCINLNNFIKCTLSTINRKLYYKFTIDLDLNFLRMMNIYIYKDVNNNNESHNHGLLNETVTIKDDNDIVYKACKKESNGNYLYCGLLVNNTKIDILKIITKYLVRLYKINNNIK